MYDYKEEINKNRNNFSWIFSDINFLFIFYKNFNIIKNVDDKIIQEHTINLEYSLWMDISFKSISNKGDGVHF